VASLGLDARKVAVERNLEIAPRSTYGDTALADGDRIEIVTSSAAAEAPGRLKPRRRGVNQPMNAHVSPESAVPAADETRNLDRRRPHLHARG
jgi:hypothetical protein